MNSIPLVISIVSLIIAIVALIIAVKAKSKTSSKRIRFYANDEFQSHFGGFTEQKVRESVEKELSRRKLLERSTITASPSASPTGDAIKQEKSQNAETVADNSFKDDGKTSNEIQLPEPISIFVGSYKTGSFKYSSSSPDGKTIFCITAGNKDAVEGVMNIEPSAYDKVAETPEYLEGACIVSGKGSQIRVSKPGVVIKEDGQWVVKEQIEVELV